MGERALYRVYVFLGTGHGEEFVVRLLKRKKIPYERVDISTDRGRSLASEYGVYNVPHGIKVDENGYIAARLNGVVDFLHHYDALRCTRPKNARKMP